MQKSKTTLAVDKAATPSLPTRLCTGVRPFAGEPALKCDAELPDGRTWCCDRCDAETERRQSTDASRRANAGHTQLLQLAGLSAPFVAGVKSLKSIRPLTAQHREALAAIERWVRWTPGAGCSLGILLTGDPGVGKSDFAEAAISEVVQRGRPGLYANARAQLLKLQGSFRDDAPESTAAIIERLATVLFLAIDDLGASRPTRFTADAMYEVLERRTRDQLPTILVSNYFTLESLAQRMAPSDGDALDAIRPVDRIDELCPTTIVIRGASMRSTVSKSATPLTTETNLASPGT
jgi:DNA replication protein DnaC